MCLRGASANQEAANSTRTRRASTWGTAERAGMRCTWDSKHANIPTCTGHVTRVVLSFGNTKPQATWLSCDVLGPREVCPCAENELGQSSRPSTPVYCCRDQPSVNCVPQVKEILIEMIDHVDTGHAVDEREDWQGTSYKLLRHNCCSFWYPHSLQGDPSPAGCWPACSQTMLMADRCQIG